VNAPRSGGARRTLGKLRVPSKLGNERRAMEGITRLSDFLSVLPDEESALAEASAT
jgi:hypothetical protein